MAGTNQELTLAMIKRYVDGGGTACPFCDSDDIEAGPLEANGRGAEGLVECSACGERWREVFALFRAEVLSTDGRYSDLPGLHELLEAADAHAAAAGDLDYAVGDLQEILRAAWRVMTPSQRAALFNEPELATLGELPEYELLGGWVVGQA